MLSLADHPAAGEIAGLAVPHHVGAAHPAKGAQGGEQVNRLKHIGLALRVVAQQQVEAGREVHVQPRIVPKVSETQVSQMHP